MGACQLGDGGCKGVLVMHLHHLPLPAKQLRRQKPRAHLRRTTSVRCGESSGKRDRDKT